MNTESIIDMLEKADFSALNGDEKTSALVGAVRAIAQLMFESDGTIVVGVTVGVALVEPDERTLIRTASETLRGWRTSELATAESIMKNATEERPPIARLVIGIAITDREGVALATRLEAL